MWLIVNMVCGCLVFAAVCRMAHLEVLYWRDRRRVRERIKKRLKTVNKARQLRGMLHGEGADLGHESRTVKRITSMKPQQSRRTLSGGGGRTHHVQSLTAQDSQQSVTSNTKALAQCCATSARWVSVAFHLLSRTIGVSILLIAALSLAVIALTAHDLHQSSGNNTQTPAFWPQRWLDPPDGERSQMERLVQEAALEAYLSSGAVLDELYCRMLNRVASMIRLEDILYVLTLAAMTNVLSHIPRQSHLAVLPNLLRSISSDLSYLMILYSFFLFSFAFLGWILFGRVLREFESLSASFGTVFHMSYGEGRTMHELTEAHAAQRMSNTEDQFVDTLLVLTFFISLQVLNHFVVMNIILATVIHGFDNVKQHMDRGTRKGVGRAFSCSMGMKAVVETTGWRPVRDSSSPTLVCLAIIDWSSFHLKRFI